MSERDIEKAREFYLAEVNDLRARLYAAREARDMWERRCEMAYAGMDKASNETLQQRDEFFSALEAPNGRCEEAERLIVSILYVFDCRCHEAYTGRGLHAPECLYVEGEDLRSFMAAALSTEDATRPTGDKE